MTMKLLLLLFMLILPIKDDVVTILVVDGKTKEELIGVKITANGNSYYTDLDGIATIEISNTDSIKIEYPSYNTTVKKIEDSTTIELHSK